MPRGDEPLGLVANQFLFENDRLKMWHLDLQPGESSDWHVHDLDYVTVVVEPAKLLREWEDGSTDELENPLGHVNFTRKHGAHRVTNVGTTHYRNALAELKE
ncbi:MAG: hypothetical protein ACE1ZZ_05145 [Dehalococcoidia bacterium]